MSGSHPTYDRLIRHADGDDLQLIQIDEPLARQKLEVELRRLYRLHFGQLGAHDGLPIGAQDAAFVKRFGAVELEVLQIVDCTDKKRGDSGGEARRKVGGQSAQKLIPGIVAHKISLSKNANHTTEQWMMLTPPAARRDTPAHRQTHGAGLLKRPVAAENNRVTPG